MNVCLSLRSSGNPVLDSQRADVITRVIWMVARATTKGNVEETFERLIMQFCDILGNDALAREMDAANVFDAFEE